ncbi:MAG TPA: DnaJ domain-containing protein, partial [Nitrospiraceae bacterium]
RAPLMIRKDFYETLGVARDVSDEDLKKAYRKLVLQYHPDRNPGNKTAEDKIREINAAYEVVGDPEKRRAYNRLRFGDEVRDEAPDPDVILEQMEQKLFDEGRKELFAQLITDTKRIKAELAVVRERTVAAQGYDTFKHAIVIERGAEILPEFTTAEMDARRDRILDVAVQMMESQGVVKKDDAAAVNALRQQFKETYQQGRIGGFGSALELLYVRR